MLFYFMLCYFQFSIICPFTTGTQFHKAHVTGEQADRTREIKLKTKTQSFYSCITSVRFVSRSTVNNINNINQH